MIGYLLRRQRGYAIGIRCVRLRVCHCTGQLRGQNFN